MGSATVEEFVELLNAEQHVDLQKLRDLARHGVQPAVRGEVWLYLLGVLSDDKGQEMTSVRSKYLEYEALDKHNRRSRSACAANANDTTRSGWAQDRRPAERSCAARAAWRREGPADTRAA